MSEKEKERKISACHRDKLGDGGDRRETGDIGGGKYTVVERWVLELCVNEKLSGTTI